MRRLPSQGVRTDEPYLVSSAIQPHTVSKVCSEPGAELISLFVGSSLMVNAWHMCAQHGCGSVSQTVHHETARVLILQNACQVLTAMEPTVGAEAQQPGGLAWNALGSLHSTHRCT